MKNKNKLMTLSVILLISVLPGLGADIYTPAMPAMARALQTTIGSVQWTMAIYMFALALAHLFFGPLSDALGRKRPLVLGLLIMIVGSGICYAATSITMLITGRLVQAFGAGACAVLWRAIFRDTYKAEEMAKYVAYLAAVVIFIVPAAPVIGGYLLYYLGWQACFLFMLVCIVITLLWVIFMFRESHTEHHVKHLTLAVMLPTYKSLLTSRVFLGFVAISLLTYGAFFSWAVSGAVLLVKVLHIKPVIFGWVSLLVSVIPMFIASRFQARFVQRLGMLVMLRLGLGLVFLGGALMLAGYGLFGINVYAIALPMVLVFMGVSLVFPNAFASAFKPFGHVAGSAASLYGCLQIAGGAITGAVMAHLPSNTPLTMAVVLIVLPVCAFALLTLQKNP